MQRQGIPLQTFEKKSDLLLSSHPSWIEINRDQFKKNLASIRKRIGKRLFCLPVKANGYGHGAYLISKIAEEEGIDYLGVSCLKEALELRLAGVHLPILVFGAIHELQLKDLIEFELEFSISSLYKANLVAQKCAHLKKKCRVHVEIDTGMHRTGVRPESAFELISFLSKHPCFEIVGIYSHLATADHPNDPFALHQIRSFLSLKKQMGDVPWIWHLANSGGALHYPESHLDMVRAGLISYGYFPNGQEDPLKEICPVLTL